MARTLKHKRITRRTDNVRIYFHIYGMVNIRPQPPPPPPHQKNQNEKRKKKKKKTPSISDTVIKRIQTPETY